MGGIVVTEFSKWSGLSAVERHVHQRLGHSLCGMVWRQWNIRTNYLWQFFYSALL